MVWRHYLQVAIHGNYFCHGSERVGSVVMQMRDARKTQVSAPEQFQFIWEQDWGARTGEAEEGKSGRVSSRDAQRERPQPPKGGGVTRLWVSAAHGVDRAGRVKYAYGYWKYCSGGMTAVGRDYRGFWPREQFPPVNPVGPAGLGGRGPLWMNRRVSGTSERATTLAVPGGFLSHSGITVITAPRSGRHLGLHRELPGRNCYRNKVVPELSVAPLTVRPVFDSWNPTRTGVPRSSSVPER